jgi:5-methylcytosine-specific restriction enzyme subunit McrC
VISTTVVREYEEREVELTSADATALSAAASSALSVRPASNDRYYVRATSYIGTLSAGQARVLIVPKAPIANVFHLLEPSGTAMTTGPEVFEYERSLELVPAFATFFARVTERSIGRGLPRQYRVQEDALLAVRGRVDVARQVRAGGLPLPLWCRFDEYTPNTRTNRIVRAATSLLAYLPGVAPATRQLLRRLLTMFEDVGTLEGGDLNGSSAFTRLDEHMEPAERLARLVLDSLAIESRGGARDAPTFLVDMNKVFEEFVGERLRSLLHPRLLVRQQETFPFNTSHRQPRINPDLVLRQGAAIAYVADTKYKLLGDEWGRAPDYYQLLAYTDALDVPEGLLIYCDDGATAPPRVVDVPNTAKSLVTKAIPLDGRPADIDRQMEALAAFIERRVQSLAAVA